MVAVSKKDKIEYRRMRGFAGKGKVGVCPYNGGRGGHIDLMEIWQLKYNH